MVNIINIYNENCLDRLQKIKDETVDLIIIDPPYAVGFSKGFDDSKKHVEEQLPLWVNELYRVLKNNCHCYVFIPVKEAGIFINEFSKKFVLNNILATRTYTQNLYLKNNFSFNNQLILYLSKGTAKRLNQVDYVKTSQSWLKDKRNKNPHEYTYQYPAFFPETIFSNQKTTSKNNKNSNRHPCEKSVSFEEILIKLSSNENDTVLDCFMGCGTTGIACKNTNRHFIGIELNEEYFNTAKERLEL